MARKRRRGPKVKVYKTGVKVNGLFIQRAKRRRKRKKTR